MKTYSLWVLVLALGTLLAACQMPDDDDDDNVVDATEVRESIEAQNARFEQYIQSDEIDSLATLYTAGGQLMAPNAPTASGESLIAMFEGMTAQGVATIDLQTTEVEADDDFAYEVGTYSLRDEQGTEVDNGKYIVIWKREDGEWKIHRDIFNSNLPPQTGADMNETGDAADTTQS